MELKTNYQYTYFIHPFIIKEEKYQEYILKMLKEKNCKLKVFQKEKDLKIYQYFLPKARENIFPSFSFNSEKLKELDKMPLNKKAKELAKLNCNIFEYTIEKDIQGKIDDKKGIFFTIQKVEIICFKTGICFVLIKTNIEDEVTFANVLNFNYKFRDINQEEKLQSYDNIRIQSNNFESTKTLQDFIKNITGIGIETTFVEDSNLNLEKERFLTYSYLCIDQEAWNANNEFQNIEHHFKKYSMILPADSSSNIEEQKTHTLSKWKYTKLGINKSGVMLFASSAEINNYTVLPTEYEEQYLYTYILNLYKKNLLKKVLEDYKTNNKRMKKKFVNFIKNIWQEEITTDEIGTELNKQIAETIELKNIYKEVKEKYEVLYKEKNIEKNNKLLIATIILLAVNSILNIIIWCA